jgi:creatinine amidohydrolase
VIEDVLNSTIQHGIKKILIVNGHGGNTAAIGIACSKIRNRTPGVFLAQSSVWLVLHDIYHELPAEVRQESWRYMVAHAGYLETSMLMAIDEQLVKLDQARQMPIEPFVQASDPALTVTLKINEMSECGSGGDPTVSDVETGNMFLEKTVEGIIEKYRKALESFY